MRKMLIIVAILAVLVFGALWWLGTQASKGKPAPGEVRIEVENAL